MGIRRITQRSARAFSSWFIVGPRNFDHCCDCGLAHENNFRVVVDERRKQVTVYMRTRRAKGRTHVNRKRRKLYGRA